MCPVCLDDLEDATVTVCLHIMCRLCTTRALAVSRSCPFCRYPLAKTDIMSLPRKNKFAYNLETDYKRSSKIEKLMEHIDRVLLKGEKCIVFS